MNQGSLDRQAELEKGLQHLGLSLATEQVGQLLCLLDMLAKWNKVYNLSAVRDPRQMVSRHLLDSLAVVPYVFGTRCIDVGTGAGLPGLPLAIALPQMEFTLLDSNSKKTRFIQHAKRKLGLGNVVVVQNRVETYRVPEKFDTVIARAFAAVPQLQALTQHLLSADGLLMAMVAKPLSPVEEEAAKINHKLCETVRLDVPGTSAERRLKLYRLQPTDQE